MTSTLTRRSQLELADASDLRVIAAQQHGHWGGGLTRSEFYELSNVQNQLPWGRKNLHVYLSRKQGQIVSSCKLYDLEIQSRSKRYKIGGIGGVFTPDDARGQGHASDLMTLMVKHGEEHQYDAMLLFSDIDPGFYESVGYELLPDNDFHIWMDSPGIEQFAMYGDFGSTNHDADLIDVMPLTPEFFAQMLRHYSRYLQRQRYGVVRSLDYLELKLRRLQFRIGIVPDWPQQEVITLDFESPQGGYALIEQDHEIMRVLEVVGSESVRATLWQNILRNALLRQVKLIRGWESAAPDFRKFVRWTQRTEWSRPMMYVINPETDPWLDLDECPLLELDHF
jgi:predicted acetyltransferase